MFSEFKNLDKAFENKVKLGVMSALVVNESLDFTALKELLGVTDGNLATHLKALESHKYVIVMKQFINKKPNTSYQITDMGRKAFEDHISALEELLKKRM